jgi:hypothetical protein
MTLLALNRPTEAEAVLRTMLTLCETELPRDHYLAPTVRTFLGRASLAQGRFEEAEEFLLAAHHELAVMQGAKPSWIRNAASALVELYERTDRMAEAELFRALWREASEPAR